MKKYRCKLCGYEVEMEEMPIDYKCPICGVSASMFEEVKEEIDNRIPISPNNPAIARIMEKCINCGRCKTICQEQVGIKYDIKNTKEPVCVNCGQCVLNCPVGALVPKYNYQKVFEAINDPEKIVIVSTSPAVRVALGEEFKMEAGSFVEGKMIAALRKLGFDYILDTTFGADLTIMEEASELVERIKNNKNLPQFTSCCPAWVKYVEMYYPELLNHISSCKSPIGMQGAIIKTYFAKMKNINPEKIVNVALTPCTAKKFEINRPELNDSSKYNNTDKLRDMDYVITTSELGLMLREKEIDFKTLEDEKYDNLLDRGSGAGLIFGNTGGVMEAALRTAYKLLTGKDPDKHLLKLEEVRGYQGVRQATIKIDSIDLKVAVVYGLKNVKIFLEKLKNNDLDYQFIEVMNCPLGCVGGGGQPLTAISTLDEIRQKRVMGLYNKEETDIIKCSYDNPDIKKIYKEFLKEPLSDLSEDLLHTTYSSKSDLIK